MSDPIAGEPPTEALTNAFRSSSRNPEHLAFLALPVLDAVRRKAWDEGHEATGCPCLFEWKRPHVNPYRAARES